VSHPAPEPGRAIDGSAGLDAVPCQTKRQSAVDRGPVAARQHGRRRRPVPTLGASIACRTPAPAPKPAIAIGPKVFLVKGQFAFQASGSRLGQRKRGKRSRQRGINIFFRDLLGRPSPCVFHAGHKTHRINAGEPAKMKILTASVIVLTTETATNRAAQKCSFTDCRSTLKPAVLCGRSGSDP
jgi:hypothetical protein